MRNLSLVTAVSLVLLWVGGCINATIYVPAPGQGQIVDDSEITIAEIDAADNLFMESDKTACYKRIAGREGIGSEAQVYLVRAACNKLFMESGKEKVLLVLIDNRSFSNPAKSEIFKNLNKLFMESSRSRVLKAISDRGTLVPVVEPLVEEVVVY